MRNLAIALSIWSLSLLLTANISVAQGDEGIEFTYIPSWGSYDDLQGRVWGVVPSEHYVAVYIYVGGGWWTKPTWANPITPIGDDGTWICDVTTGGMDHYAKRFAAFLLPNEVEPILRSGESILPEEYSGYPHIIECRLPGNRVINFSGYDWVVKQCDMQVGPGGNYFSDDEGDVWVDGDGRLHMRIAYRDGRWWCTEVIADTSFGHGKYIFYVEGRIDILDPNIVAGLFTWDECAPEYNYREIDIEFSRWGNPGSEYNAQYAIQPWDIPGNIHRFRMALEGTDSTHIFTWDEESIEFQSLYGHIPAPLSDEDIIESWSYTGSDNPPPGFENPRINFWLFNGNPPSDEAEIIINRFEFVEEPYPDKGCINGHVTDMLGNPIKWAFVIAKKDLVREVALTDASGFYEITDLEPGEYLLLAYKKGYRLGFAKVTVLPGDCITKDFKLREKTGEDDEDEFPDLSNFPNPFNPDTWIPYQVREDCEVIIKIHDSSGSLIRCLNLGHKPAGLYISKDNAAYWDGRNEAGEEVASGIYFYTIQAGEFAATKKMVVKR